MPIEDLQVESLPECQEVKHAIPFNDMPNSNPEWESMMKEKSYISTYIAAGFGSVILLIILTVLLLRYVNMFMSGFKANFALARL